MLSFFRLMRNFAILAMVLSLTVSGTGEEKPHSCCTNVSTKRLSMPILGYRIQNWNPPCVKAVIFETEDGPKCSHWKEKWVFAKVLELELARRNLLNSTSSTQEE